MNKISILVDNFKRSYLLPLLMKAYNIEFLQNDIEDVEMIVVDDNSNDNFEEFIKLGVENIKPKFSVKAFQTNKPTTYNPAKALNIAFKQSIGDIIILNHSDIIPNSECTLQNFMREFNEGKADIVVPHFVFDMNTLETYTGMLNNGTAMRRNVYEKVRGHDERFLGGPSVDFDLMNRIRDNKQFSLKWLKEDKRISYLHIGHLAEAGIRFKDTHPEWRHSLGYAKEEHSYKRLREYNNYLASRGGHHEWEKSNIEWGTLDTLQKVFEYEKRDV